mgnify:CR=1 FL=1
MKKVLLLPILAIFSFTSVFAEIEDDSIIEELNKENTTEIATESLQFKTFNSCEDLEKVTNDFLKNYNSKYGNYYRKWGGVIFNAVDDVMMEDSAAEAVETKSLPATSGKSDFSETNEQVQGVSESEIIKTDGDYIYYMSDYYDNAIKDYNNRQKKNVFVIDASTMKVVKKIKLPKHFWGTQLYLEDDKLIILASGRPTGTFQKKYWDNSSKTYTIIYDVSKPEEAKMIKAFMTEWNFTKSRLIDNKLYVISRKDSYNLFRWYTEEKPLSANDIIPKGLEIFATNNDEEKNVETNWKKRDYNVNTGYVAKCNEIEYILPDSDTDLGYPQFNLISVIDINDIEDPAYTTVIFWNLNEIYMSLDNLYLTNSVYKTEPFRCAPNMRCIAPYYYGWTNHTLIHKMNINGEKLSYQTSALVEGSPLTQYSMDEYKDDFRILTKTNRWNSKWEEAHTDLYILDENLELKSSLQGLWGWEDFKSSRYIGDKLFLVTFEQIDPLFVIDLADAKNPKIIGELKMPWYSTYLHPYDENHLIGIGYDTKENKWGGVQNNGIKIDLYEIDYDKKPTSKDNTWDIYVAQKHSLVLWEYGSYSEALSNPRMFMWKAEDNTLLLPMTLKKNHKDDQYRAIDFFQGLVSIDIDKDAWIKENYKITHIETGDIESERIKECSKYTVKDEESECTKLLDGSLYCPVKNRYVPKYCYAESPIGEYLASKSWNYSKDFVKRAIWIGDKVYSISDTQIKSSNLGTWEKIESVKLK